MVERTIVIGVKVLMNWVTRKNCYMALPKAGRLFLSGDSIPLYLDKKI
jgi:hypothetical protein